jgi:hypothetical protein
VIRQAISCDICGTEKKHTNNWFVSHEQGGELRLSGWTSRNRVRPGSRHLCGQTCLHKLVDEFMARLLSTRLSTGAAELPETYARPRKTDTSLTSPAAFEQIDSSARLLPSLPPVVVSRSNAAAAAAVGFARVAVPAPSQLETAVAPQAGDAPGDSSRKWRTEAWQRERERELRSGERRPEIAPRRRSTF